MQKNFQKLFVRGREQIFQRFQILYFQITRVLPHLSFFIKVYFNFESNKLHSFRKCTT